METSCFLLQHERWKSSMRNCETDIAGDLCII